MGKTFPIFSTFKYGFEQVWRNIWILLGAVLTLATLGVLSVLLLYSVMSLFVSMKLYAMVFALILLALACYLFYAVLVGAIGMVKMGMLLAQDREISFDVLFSQEDIFWRYYGAVTLAGLFVGLGSLLLVIPGIYLALRFYFVPQVIIEEGCGVFEALQRSSRLTLGVKWRLLGLILAFTLIIIVFSLGFGVVVGMSGFLVSVLKAMGSGIFVNSLVGIFILGQTVVLQSTSWLLGQSYSVAQSKIFYLLKDQES